ncbi:MAG: YibE/F family protein [Corynebacterium sp.]|nr:YibE/F family protein [Corynebacterium sp.]
MPTRPFGPWNLSQKLLAGGLIISFLLTVLAVGLTWPRGESLPISSSFSATSSLSREAVKGTVEIADRGICSSPDDGRVFADSPRFSTTDTAECLRAVILLTDGPDAGQRTLLTTYEQPGEPTFEEGQHVILNRETRATGETGYTFADYQRGLPLTIWLILTVAAFILIGGRQGARSLLGVLIAIVGVVAFLIPGLLHGGNPLVLAVVCGSAILFPALYIVHGIHWKTSAALAGTLIALVIAALLGAFAIGSSQLRGLGDDSNLLITLYIPDLQISGLMLAGFIIGALGVLNDTTVSQASTVNELAESGHSRWQIFAQAMRVGRDHIASMIYTLVLGYTGAALPLLLLISLSGRDLMTILTSDVVATELLRSAVGAIALVLAVPLTTLIAALTIRTRD